MHRITLTIENYLLRQLRKKAFEEGRTLEEVTNDLLRRSLSNPPAKPFKLELQGWKAAEQPGVNLLDRGSLFDHMDAH
jgi:hypothetical protein